MSQLQSAPSEQDLTTEVVKQVTLPRQRKQAGRYCLLQKDNKEPPYSYLLQPQRLLHCLLAKRLKHTAPKGIH